MNMLRKTNKNDIDRIYILYKATASILGGLARDKEEITEEYISTFVMQSLSRGLSLVIEKNGDIIGEIHAVRPEPKVFHHIFSELTICIHPAHQGTGYGRKLFSRFMKIIQDETQDIKRVELIARESNAKAISFYKSFGFEIEGCLKHRINGVSNKLENDIPMGWLR